MGGKSSPMTDFSKISKLLQKNIQNTSTAAASPSLMTHYNTDQFNSIFGPKPTTTTPDTQQVGNFPLNEPIGQQEDGKKVQALPNGYNQFVPPDQFGNWVEPSNEAVAKNWPTDMGGGQYITDPTQPGKMVKSSRAIMDSEINPGAKQKILGSLPPNLFQVDHIVPLWIGGADTIQNLQVLDNITHERKTAAQAVPLTLLVNGKITLDQAKLMALTWKDKDSSGIPTVDDNGYIPLNVAERYAKKWENQITKPIGGLFDKRVRQNFGSSFKENMSNFGRGWLPTPLREFAKGLVGGGTAGIVPGTAPSEDTKVFGKVANVAGNIVGTITGLGLLSKGIGATVRGAKALVGANKAITLTDEAAKAAGLVTDVGNVSKAASIARMEKLEKMAKSAGLLSVWGQLGLVGKEATGQMDVEMKDHMKQFFVDIAFGGLLGSAGQTAKGYATVGLGATSFSLMEGASIEDALKDGALMTALHGMGYKRGIIDPKLRVGNEEAYKMSADTINRYLGDVVPTVKKGQTVPGILKLDIPKLDNMRVEFQKKYPNDQRFKGLGTINNDTDAIHFIEQASKRSLGNLIAKSDGSISQETIKQEMIRITTAKNQLYNQTLPPQERLKKEWQDLLSMGEKLKPKITSDQIRPAQNANDNLKKVPLNIPNETYSNTNMETFPIGKGGVTGYGEKLDPQAKANIDDFAKNPNNYDGKIYIPKTDKETAMIQRLVNSEYAASGKEAPTQNPEHTLRAFIRTVDGEFKPIGYLPQEGSFNTKKYDLNMTYREQIGRFRHTIETAKSPEQLKSMLLADKSKISIDDNTAKIIFEKKNTLSDEELYKLLKPTEIYHKLDSNLNNSNIWKKMDELGIDNLVIDPLKAWEIGGGRPRYNPSNPYINLDIAEQDWLRSMAIKDGSIGKSTPVPVSTPKPEQVAIKASGAIKDRQSKLPIETPPTVPIKAPITAVEAPETPKMSIMPPKPKTLKNTSTVEAKTATSVPVGTTKNQDLVDQFFGKIVHDIEYRKVKPSSPESLKKTYGNIIESFKAKNPGINEKEFKNALADAKSRAEAYADDLVDDMYKGTVRFGTEDTYKRNTETQVNPEYWRAKQAGLEDDEIKLLNISKEIPKTEKVEYEGRDVKLAKEFGLKLKEPNETGIQYLELDRSGSPVFSAEYLKAHPKTKGSPLDVWGSFLGNELRANKKELSVHSETFGEQIKQMKKSTNPYSKGVAESIDKVLAEKYDVRDPKTRETKYPWSGSWKLNSGLKKIKSLFDTKNDEGQLITQPFRRIVEQGSKADYQTVKKNVARADAKTREVTEKARESRENDMSSGKAPNLPNGMRVKDKNQIQDVSEDLTPYDLLHSGLVRKETRDNLIDRYNNIISSGEVRPERRVETRNGTDGEKILGTIDEMNRLFNGIKKLSAYIPESKKWKPGKRIVIKNGEPTFEEGVNDGIKIAAQILKLNSSKGFVNFDKIKKSIVDSNTQKGSIPVGVALKLGLGALGATGLATIGSKTTYTAPEKPVDVKVPNGKLGDILMQLESSGGLDKRSADAGEVKWLTGLTNSAINELKRTGLKESVNINNKADVIDASIKYFNLMKKRHPELTDAEVYVDHYWGGAKDEAQRQRTIEKFNKLTA